MIAKYRVPGGAIWRTQRSGRALVVVAAVHVALVFALANAAPNATAARIDGPLDIVMLSAEPDAAQEPPVPPSPRMDPPQIEAVIAPTFDIAPPDPAATNAITVALVREVRAQPALGVPKLISTIEYLRPPAPRYPRTARALGQRGLVILRALIDVTGHATDVIVHRSTGYPSLDEAARRAVLEAAFKPYEENGRRQPAFVLIPIEFDPSYAG
jgi:periplasmic protein TonB